MPSRRPRRRFRHAITVLCVALVLAGTACQEASVVESQIRMSVRNDTAATVYWVKGSSMATVDVTRRGPHQPIPSGTTSTIGLGGVEVDPGAGGCFQNEQLWLVRSRTGVNYDLDDPPSTDDIIIVEYWDAFTCFDESNIEVTLP